MEKPDADDRTAILSRDIWGRVKDRNWTPLYRSHTGVALTIATGERRVNSRGSHGRPGEGGDGVADRRSALRKIGDPQTSGPEGCVVGEFGHTERVADTGLQPVVLALDEVQCPLLTRVRRQRSDQRHIGISRQVTQHPDVCVAKRAQHDPS